MADAPEISPAAALDDPAQFLALGLQLATSRAGGLALALVERALARHGDDPAWQAVARAVCTADVPEFHHRMLRDSLRNAAYRAAIDRLVPGKTVLDIGTGSGLLAMMAARAGATQVYACEANPMLAATARTIIAANGLADRIRVFDCHSSKLDRVRDLAGGVDVVVSEIFDEGVIGEGVLSSLAHARRALARPGAVFVPERASIRAALAEFAPLPQQAGPVEGFDLAGFARHVMDKRYVYADDPTLVLRSEPAELMTFDFASGDPPDRGDAARDLISTGGRVSGMAQWLRLTFAPDIIYENRPGSAPDLHWVINLARCPAQDTGEGDRFRVGLTYAAESLALWCAPEGRPPE
jgi:type II protein arginine methyltransferase